MRKKTYSMTLTPDTVEGLKPFFAASGISMSSYVDQFLTGFYRALTDTADIDYSKSAQDLTIREITKMTNSLEVAFSQKGQIDLTPAMTEEEIKKASSK